MARQTHTLPGHFSPLPGSVAERCPMKKSRNSKFFSLEIASISNTFTAARRAFTLVEILIVVVILGIMAAIVVPKFSNAGMESRENMLKENLRILRTQISIYHVHHWDTSPGYDSAGNPSAQAVVDQLTMFTDNDGNTNATASEVFEHGPYMSEMPENPLNGQSSITIINDADSLPVQPNNNTGWIYKPGDMIFKANSPGFDVDGFAYYDY